VSRKAVNKGKLTTAVCACALVASLVLARVHPFGNAGLYAAIGSVRPTLTTQQMPPDVRSILQQKCADCHSNQTRAPFYGHFAPVSWLMERDIVEARKVMNLSAWDAYTPDQQQTLAAKMAQQIKSHKMPPIQYRAIHWDANTTDADLATISTWAHGPQTTQSASATSGSGDPTRGQALFEKRCTGCHALNANHQGPALQTAYGRTSGTASGYAYSDALKKAAIVWNENSLDKWLTDPDHFIPGNNMDFLVAKPQERADLISFLRNSSNR